MSRLFGLLALSLAIVVLCGCALQRSNMADAAKQKMIGMDKEDVLACMGVPAKKAHIDETEVWNYHSTDGYGTSASNTHKFGTTDWLSGGAHQRYFCDINIVMKNDKVAKVHYNGPTSESWFADDEQCGYAVAHCVHGD